MKERYNSEKTFLASTRIFVLIVAIGASFMAFADAGGTNSVSIVDQTVEVVKSYIPEIKGNAIWDIVKLMLSWGLQIILASILFLVVVCSLFSQRIHVALFINGRRRGLFWFSGTKPFGRLVTKSETREYRKFYSPARKRVVDALNAHSGVFLVMGPSEVGKRLLALAESKAKFVLAVDRDDWYDCDGGHPPVKEILRQRTELLVRHLLLRKPVCIVLTWRSGGISGISGKVPLPSHERMQDIIRQLVGILGQSRKFCKVSFVVTVPAHYQLESIRKVFLGECVPPEALSVALLNCTECLSLLDAQLDHKAKRSGFDKTVKGWRRELEDRARNMGLALERMVWIESFGMPGQVIRVVSTQEYSSSEVWGALHDWWAQMYGQDGANAWFSYLYTLGLESLISGGTVNAEAFARRLFPDDDRKVENALKMMCVNRRPRGGDNGDKSPMLRYSSEFDPKRIEPELVFEDPYVIECFVGSLGSMQDETGKPIFNFRTDLSKVVPRAFALDDNEECAKEKCAKIAAAYLRTTERFVDLAERLKQRYKLLDDLKGTFESSSKLVLAYEQCLKDPVVFQDFVCAVISRIGALPAATFTELRECINGTLRKNNSSPEYVTLMFEMLPVFVIAELLPCAWEVDFKTLVDEMVNPGTTYEVRFKCAAIICVAYAHYKGEAILGGNVFCAPDVQEHSEFVKSAYSTVADVVGRESGRWSFLERILQVIDTMEQHFQLQELDVGALPSDVRMTWLSVFCILMWVHGAKTDSDVSMEVVFSISNILDGVGGLTWSEGLLIRMYRSQMPYWVDYDVKTVSGIAYLKQDINDCRSSIEKWSDCPIIAAKVFSSICTDYWYVCSFGVEELWNPNVLWELHGILNEWRRGMSDTLYADCLATFAFFLCSISKGKIKVDLCNIWKDFAERVREFWLPILKGERGIEDWVMPDSFFRLYSSLSNVKTVPTSIRVALLQEIAPNALVFCGENVNRVRCAWNIYNLDGTLVLPHTKMSWCAQVMAGKQATHLSNDSAEVIRAAEELIKEARADEERNVDEELVRMLYEANGLSMDIPVERDAAGRAQRGDDNASGEVKR